MDSIIREYHKHKTLILYLVFGGLTVAVNTVVYYVLYSLLEFSNLFSTIVAWIAAVLFAYITNRIFVFESQKTKKSEIFTEMASFFLCRGLTGILDVVVMVFTVDYMEWNSLLWKTISNAIVIILNYLASKHFIFHKKGN